MIKWLEYLIDLILPVDISLLDKKDFSNVSSDNDEIKRRSESFWENNNNNSDFINDDNNNTWTGEKFLNNNVNIDEITLNLEDSVNDQNRTLESEYVQLDKIYDKALKNNENLEISDIPKENNSIVIEDENKYFYIKKNDIDYSQVSILDDLNEKK